MTNNEIDRQERAITNAIVNEFQQAKSDSAFTAKVMKKIVATQASQEPRRNRRFLKPLAVAMGAGLGGLAALNSISTLANELSSSNAALYSWPPTIDASVFQLAAVIIAVSAMGCIVFSEHAPYS